MSKTITFEGFRLRDTQHPERLFCYDNEHWDPLEHLVLVFSTTRNESGGVDLHTMPLRQKSHEVLLKKQTAEQHAARTAFVIMLRSLTEMAEKLAAAQQESKTKRERHSKQLAGHNGKRD